MFTSILMSLALQASTTTSGWNAGWTLDAERSSPKAKDGAALGYRFLIIGDSIRWEIPELSEVVLGKLDGQPMRIVRNGRWDARMTLAVTRLGPDVLLYKIAAKGKVVGGGRMTLVDGGRAWIDLTCDAPCVRWGSVVTYIKK